MSFTATVNKGFHLNFKNGLEISVQWGYGNYCSNRQHGKDYLESMQTQLYESETAEILITKGKENLTSEFAKAHDIQSDGSVAGWLTSDNVADAITWAKNYKSV